MKQGDKEWFPEVLIDTKNNGGKEWQADDWWFHTSYSNCEGKGKYNNYSTCKEGQKQGWNGNNFPLNENQAVEIVIDKSLLKLNGNKIRMAVAVGDSESIWHFPDTNIKIDEPPTWPVIEL